jgi:hypothetical protein
LKKDVSSSPFCIPDLTTSQEALEANPVPHFGRSTGHAFSLPTNKFCLRWRISLLANEETRRRLLLEVVNWFEWAFSHAGGSEKVFLLQLSEIRHGASSTTGAFVCCRIVSRCCSTKKEKIKNETDELVWEEKIARFNTPIYDIGQRRMCNLVFGRSVTISLSWFWVITMPC